MHIPKNRPDRPRCYCSDPFALQTMSTGIAKHRVVAYMRGETATQIARQQQLIEEFCKAHGYKVVSAHNDCGLIPGRGLDDATAALASGDTLIVSDLERLVTHHASRGRDLRPILHKFMCEEGKHLISIAEGINSTTPTGQAVALECMTQLKDAEDQESWCR